VDLFYGGWQIPLLQPRFRVVAMRLRLNIAALLFSFGSFYIVSTQLAAVFPAARLTWDFLVFGMIALALILTPGLRRSPGWLVLGASLFLWVVIKFLLIDTSSLNWTYIVVLWVEIVFLLLIAGLAHEISRDLAALHKVEPVSGIGTAVPPTLDSETAVRTIRQEMRWSRRYERPLSLILFNSFPHLTEPETVKAEPAAQGRLAQHRANVGAVLSCRLRMADRLFVDSRKNRFAVICPETDADESVRLADSLTQALLDEFGFKATCAVASFPADGLTFNKLLELTTAALESSDSEALPVRKPLSPNAYG
jgi:hypothetical protein